MVGERVPRRRGHHLGPVPVDDPGDGEGREKKKYDAIEPAVYTDEEIDEIDAEYAAATRRGGEPRFWEDVVEGETVGPMIKGPLLVTDVVCWHVGMGMGLYDVKPLALGAANRRRIPRFFAATTRTSPTSSNASTGIPSGPGEPATPPPTTTAASARPG